MSGSIDVGAVTVTIAICVALGALVVSYLQRRNRSQIALLIERLAELEKRDTAPKAQPPQGDPRLEPGDEDTAVPSRPSSPRDPLAGLTSHARRIVEGVTDPDCLADEAIVCIASHIGESYAPAQLADALRVSLRSLERGLSLALGCTPGQLILAMKMREARRLLISGRYRVNEVARQLDFSTAEYFSRRFKDFWGVSPKRLALRHSHLKDGRGCGAEG
jgi:AraC-like DNA-binding protein